MHFFTASSLLLTALATAQGVIIQSINCPGALFPDDTGDTDDEYCCIGGDVTVSDCPGWPICKGPKTVNVATQTPNCGVKIATTVSNYDDLVSSASSRYLNDAGSITATATGDDMPVETGDSSFSATGSSTLSVSTTSGTRADSTPTGGSDDDDSNGGPGMLGATLLGPICGGVMAYAALQ